MLHSSPFAGIERHRKSFVKTFKRDYARLSILPDAATVINLLPAWFEDYNDVHPHSGLKFLSP
jgi:putative transposase